MILFIDITENMNNFAYVFHERIEKPNLGLLEFKLKKKSPCSCMIPGVKPVVIASGWVSVRYVWVVSF